MGLEALLPVGNNQFAIIDYDNLDLFSKMKWHVVETKPGHFYVQRWWKENGQQRTEYIHRLVLGIKDPEVDVDHVNRDTFDNRRTNLRLATASQNGANRVKHSHRQGLPCTSKFKGVSWNKLVKRWTAQIKVRRKQIVLGYFKNELAAAYAYDQAALKHFGEFALINGVFTVKQS